MARTRWPSDLGTPASSPGQADQTGSAGGCQKNLGAADRSFPKTTSGVSRLAGQAGPRPPTLRPNQSKTAEAGPEHLSTSSLPTMRYGLGLVAQLSLVQIIRYWTSSALRRSLGASGSRVD